MAGERRINFGADATDARYAIEDTGNGANFILARDTTGGTVLLEYDDAAGEWVNRGGVDMDGNDISNVGTVNANSVSTGQASIGEGRFETIAIPPSNFDSDGDSSTNFSLNVSGLSGAGEAELLIVCNGNGAVATGTVEIQINGRTGTNYDQIVANAGSLSNQTGLTSFQYEVFEQASRRDRFSLTAAGDQTEIKQLTGATVTRDAIISGDLGGGNGIDSVSVSGAFNAAGRMYVKEITDSAP